MSQFLSSNELFINVKNPPKWNPKKHYFDQSIDVLDFYAEEKRKITEGVTIGGYFIHPWLYWHINFFKTPVPQKTGEELLTHPDLDDNFLYLIENYQEAERNNLGIILFGSRGYGKSTSMSSLITWLNSTKANGVTSVIGGSDKDLKAISNLLQTGFNNVHPAMFVPQNIKDWESQVELGIKEKDGFRLPHSHIAITNANKGTESSSEKGAGLSPVGFILDEALHEDTMIPTPNGEITMKDLKVGDYVFGKNGNPVQVKRKVDVGIRQTYSVILKDGRHLDACENHIWEVFNTSVQKYERKTTKELMLDYRVKSYNSKMNKTYESSKYFIDLCQPTEYLKKDLPLDPYYFGLFLGDGTSSTGGIISIDEEIKDFTSKYFTSLGCKIRIEDKGNGTHLLIPSSNRSRLNHPIRTPLKDLNVLNNKHIPTIYIETSFEDRMELLRGLLDSDGTISSTGTISFNTSDTNIRDGFIKLVASLGIRYHLKQRKSGYKNKQGEYVRCKDSYRISLFTDLIVFKLQRKVDKLRVFKDSKKAISYRKRVSLKDIIPSKIGQSYCITVDAEDSLFLAGNYMLNSNCGKFACKGVLQSALPSFKTQYGMKLVPVLSGTSGNQDLSKDAKDILSNPESFSLLPMNWDTLDRRVDPDYITWERSKKEKFGTFVPGQMSYRLPVEKVTTNLAKFTGTNDKHLAKISVKETDWAKASTYIQNENAAFKKEEDREKNRMYFPLEIADVFITSSSNPFPTAIIDRRIRELEDLGILGKSVTIYNSTQGYRSEFSGKKRAEVSHGGGEADAPIILFDEMPIETPPKHLFVSGLDDYKLDQSDTDSLGAFYVIKRRNLEPNSPAERIVASYVARPFRHADFHVTCETILDCWVAICNMEAVDTMFLQHLNFKHKAEQSLCSALSFSNSINNGNHKSATKFGTYPTAGNKAYMFNLVVDYTKEEHVMGIDEDGNQIIKYGVDFIEDIDLLKEMLNWRKGGNFDRITAFMHALAYARELDKKDIRPKESLKNMVQQQVNRIKPKLAVFGNRRPSAF